MVEVYTMEIEESDKKVENQKKKCDSIIQEDNSPIPERLYKRIILALTKPSYLLGLGLRSSKSFRWEHRDRLCNILRQLVRQHNWKEASGVLSVLLRGTKEERCPELNRLKYLVSMELLKHIHGDDINRSRIKNIYDTWISRTGSTKDWHIEDRSVVYLEQILLFLTQENDEDASHAASRCKIDDLFDPQNLKENRSVDVVLKIWSPQRREFGNHPMSYMVIGLTFYQLWYSKFLKEMQWKDADQFDTSSQPEMLRTRFSNQVGYSEGHNAAYSHETGTSFRCDSETSVMNDKRSIEANNNIDREISMEVDVNLQKENVPQLSQPLGIYVTYDENQASLHNDDAHVYNASFFSTLGGLESWLLPLQLPKNSEYYMQMLKDPYYKDAVKYLQLALYSTPPVLAALHPLVQLLLIGGQVDSVMNEIEKFCNNLSGALPFRIRASILESFFRKNSMLSNYYEDILKKDPTCCNSLARLFNMHQNGDYSSESLLEMIALHLDATYSEYNAWREFVLCFLRLSSSDEDRMSVCLNGNEGERKQQFSVRYNRIPKIFTEGKSGKAWRFRCRWWLTRHFSNKMLASEIATGDLKLLTYKAASASHMYDQEFDYLKVYNLLENDNNTDLFMFLQMHMHNSLRLLPNYQQRTR